MTGLPWWASIMCTTLALRTAITLPLRIYQSIIIAKVEALQKEIAVLACQLRFEISVKAKEKGWSEKTCRFHFKKNLKRIMSELYVRDNCHPLKASLLIWVQLPMWICLSLALRNLSLGHVPLDIRPQTAGAFKVPKSMSLYWLSSSCVGLAHNLLLRSPRFRAVCRIPPTRSDSETPYKDIAAAFVAKDVK